MRSRAKKDQAKLDLDGNNHDLCKYTVIEKRLDPIAYDLCHGKTKEVNENSRLFDNVMN